MASGMAAPVNGSSIVTGPSAITTPKWTREATANATVVTTSSAPRVLGVVRHRSRADGCGVRFDTSHTPGQMSHAAQSATLLRSPQEQDEGDRGKGHQEQVHVSRGSLHPGGTEAEDDAGD